MSNNHSLSKISYPDPEATHHKTLHNITTLANIPLVAWLICSAFSLRNASYTDFETWMAHPVNIVAAILFVIVTLKHFTLELEVVFEDYISNMCVRKAIITCMKLFWFVLAVATITAILKIGL